MSCDQSIVPDGAGADARPSTAKHLLAAIGRLRFPDLMGRVKVSDIRAWEQHIVAAVESLRDEQARSWDARDIVQEMVDHAHGEATRESIRASMTDLADEAIELLLVAGDVVDEGDKLAVRR